MGGGGWGAANELPRLGAAGVEGARPGMQAGRGGPRADVDTCWLTPVPLPPFHVFGPPLPSCSPCSVPHILSDESSGYYQVGAGAASHWRRGQRALPPWPRSLWAGACLCFGAGEVRGSALEPAEACGWCAQAQSQLPTSNPRPHPPPNRAMCWQVRPCRAAGCEAGCARTATGACLPESQCASLPLPLAVCTHHDPSLTMTPVTAPPPPFAQRWRCTRRAPPSRPSTAGWWTSPASAPTWQRATG